MNEDEAFIRAIVDGPGDDLPRLVYADWLDDRDDPRGAYLRAEREAVEAGDFARLKELVVGLDPVWVARVSRPPIGVCCDRVIVKTGAKPAEEAAVCEYESRAGFSLPVHYRAFLLNHNGGRMYPDSFPVGTEVGEFGSFCTLSELEHGNFITLNFFRDPNADPPEPHEEPDARLLWVAGDESGLFIQIDGRGVGRVRYSDGNDGPGPVVAGTLGELLARLTTHNPEWVRLAIAGKTDELLRLLDKGPGVNVRDGYWSPLYAAVNWERIETVRELLARGARVAPASQMFHGCSHAEIRKLLDDAVRAQNPNPNQT